MWKLALKIQLLIQWIQNQYVFVLTQLRQCFLTIEKKIIFVKQQDVNMQINKLLLSLLIPQLTYLFINADVFLVIFKPIQIRLNAHWIVQQHYQLISMVFANAKINLFISLDQIIANVHLIQVGIQVTLLAYVVMWILPLQMHYSSLFNWTLWFALFIFVHLTHQFKVVFNVNAHLLIRLSH